MSGISCHRYAPCPLSLQRPSICRISHIHGFPMTHLEIFPKWMVSIDHLYQNRCSPSFSSWFLSQLLPHSRSPPLPSRATHSCFPVPNAKDRTLHPSNKYPRCPKNRRSPKGSTQQPRLNRKRNHWLKYWPGIKGTNPNNAQILQAKYSKLLYMWVVKVDHPLIWVL